MDVSHWKTGWELWDFVAFLRERGVLGPRAIFRGHANADWKLVPGLYRREVHIFGDGYSQEQLYLIAEQRMLKTFFGQALLLLPQFERNDLVDRVIAQHYGVPTQLLDWTLDPFIALYFVVSDDAQEGSDGAFYYAMPSSAADFQSPVALPFNGRLTRLVPPVVDERVRAQKSVFTLQSFGSGDSFVPLDDRQLKFSAQNDSSHPSDEVHLFGRVILPGDRKRQILEQLMEMGVDASQVFPGLSGIGQRIAARARLSNYGGYGEF